MDRPACARRRPASAPTRSKFSSAKPIGSMILWHDAHTGFPRCASRRCRSDVTFTASGSFSRLVSTPGGGTGPASRAGFRESTGRACTGDVLVDTDVTVQHAALPQQAAARAVGRQRHAAEVAAVDVRDAVVACQPFVHERVVRAEQVDDAAVVADDALEEHLGFTAGTPGAGCRRTPSPTSARWPSSRR
mgnify:CR=1 FL=1